MYSHRRVPLVALLHVVVGATMMSKMVLAKGDNPAPAPAPTTRPEFTMAREYNYHNYTQIKAASIYRGDPVTLDFYTCVAADFDMSYFGYWRFVVSRLASQGSVKFEPRYIIEDGREPAIGCRNPDGSSLDPLEHDEKIQWCNIHCLNNGRYCDPYSSFHRDADTNEARKKHFGEIAGNTLLFEAARRKCIWEEYGKGDFDLFIMYHERLFPYCFMDLSTNCTELAIARNGMSVERIVTCMKGEHGIGPDVDHDNEVLESLVADWKVVQDHPEPRMYINNEVTKYAVEDTSVKTTVEETCGAFPDNHKPEVCVFCQDYCGTHNAINYMAHCFWLLKCGDDTLFSSYLNETGQSAPEIIYRETDHPEGISAAATVMVAILGIIFAVGAFMALRVWRTRRIIQRYVREQQQFQIEATKNTGHKDPMLFPDDDDDLDLDVEPSLQYRDHIPFDSNRGSSRGTRSFGTTQAAVPPGKANFLPRLT